MAAAFYASIPFASLKDEVPEPCEPGIGIDEEGILHWTMEGVRFINILQDQVKNPNIPPLDSPEGTLWRFEATADADALESGTIVYGEASNDASAQRFPRDAESAPSELNEGETYTFFSATRMSAAHRHNCTFTYPISKPSKEAKDD